MRRIFIAINLPENAKRTLQEFQQEWADLPIRFTRRDSLHLTVVFIGHVSDEKMLAVCQKAKSITKRHQLFVLNFGRICLGPPGKAPRLIWLEGEKNQPLFNLKRELETVIFPREADPRAFADAEREFKFFVPHITIARIRQIQWKQLKEKPVINKEISISIPVDSIEVMESSLKKDGAEYIVLASAELRR